MKKIDSRYVIRHIEVGNILETLFLFAVVSAVSIRAILHILGYPQVSSESLHIAHMLWGGLIMLLGLVVAVGFITKESRYIAAAIGGIGFGLFIDELGKFITHDYNYFYRPAFVVVYLLFLILFVFFRAIARAVPMTTNEKLINSLELLKDALVHDFDEDEQRMVKELVQSVPKNNSMAKALREMIETTEVVPAKKSGWFYRVKVKYQAAVSNTSRMRWLMVYFSLYALVQFGVSLWLMSTIPSWWNLGMIASSVLVIVNVGLGIVMMMRAKWLLALERFRAAVIVSIVLVQFFQLYYSGLLALLGVVISVITLTSINLVMGMESARAKHHERYWYGVFRKMAKTFVKHPDEV